MGITRSRAAERTPHPRSERPAPRHQEFWLLVLISLLIALGAYLGASAQARVMSVPLPGVVAEKPVNLNEIGSASELEPLLGFYARKKERSFAAAKIFLFAQDQGPIEGVGALGELRIPVRAIERTRGLDTLSARVHALREENPGIDAVPLLTSAQLRQLRPLLAVRSAEGYYRRLCVYGIVFLIGFYALHFAWRMKRFTGDQLILPAVHLLSGFGFLMMIVLRDPLRDPLLVDDFAVGVAIGCVLAYLASLPHYERSPLRRLAYVPLLLSFALSLALILFGSGPGVSDAKVNLRLGSFQFQPVEAIKLLLLFFLAGFFADRWEFLRRLKEAPKSLPGVLRHFEVPRLRYVLPMLVAVALAIAFFFLERDLGPALVMTILFIVLYATARSRLFGAVAASAAVVGAVAIGYALNVPRTVSARLSMWLSPWDNFIRSGGDHLAQSLWTFSTGGLFGTGLGLGDPASVPAAHTDLVLAAIGEELGFVGLVLVALAYAALVYRALRIALCGRGAYSFFLGFAATLLIALQALFIAAGILGLAPLSGVVTPFVNYGKSSTISSFILVGILFSISRDGSSRTDRGSIRGPVAETFGAQAFATGCALGIVALIVLGQAARIQIIEADRYMGRGALIPQADGHRRYTYNPRLVAAARSIPRGSIYDRNGIPLASDSAALVESYRSHYEQLHIDLDKAVKPGQGRIYPFGALAFHLLGDVHTKLNWGAPNSSYIERDWNAVLQGYDDRAMVVRVEDRPGEGEHLTIRRDLRELVPLVRYRHQPERKEVRDILNRNRDLHLTIDIRLQTAVAAVMKKYASGAGSERGAAVTLDPETGDLLASVSYPLVDIENDAPRLPEMRPATDEIPANAGLGVSLLDRARYGLYPPGSSFKIVTAMAALTRDAQLQRATYDCRRLPDGRVGNYVKGWGRPIRDDVMDKEPHGRVDLARGIVVSCNAFFAQLGVYAVGPDALLETAGKYGIRVASPNTPARLKDALPQAAYGQGQVVVSPLQMARVAASIGNRGRIVAERLVREDATAEDPAVHLSPDQAALLARHLRSAVLEGTGREAAKATVPIAGKTGTAEVKNKPAHAWFVGFAPYGDGARETRKISFAVLIENGRYGGRASAPAAAEIVDAAARLGLIGVE